MVDMVNSTDPTNSSVINSSNSYKQGQLDWDSGAQHGLLSAYFYGYMVLQIPGGWLSAKYGPRLVMGVGMFLAGLVTLLTPLATEYDIMYVYAIRIVAGLCGGVVYPSIYTTWGRWAPPLEASLMIAVAGAGCGTGAMLTFAVSGVLCDSTFLGGWPSVFYITGSSAMLWSIFWMIFMRNSPESSTTISVAERNYILHSQDKKQDEGDLVIPWCSILTSPATWACAACSFSTDWLDYTLLTCLPTFMHDVLKYDIKSNGFLSCLPILTETLTGVFAARLVDYIRERKILTTTCARKVFQTIAYIGAAGFLIGTGFIPEKHRFLAVVFLSLSTAFNGFSLGGYCGNLVDFAPRYAGIVCGIGNVFGTLPGMISPIVTGLLTPQRSQDEWKNVFYLGASVALAAGVIFIIFARGNLQTWAKPQYKEIKEKTENSVSLNDNSINI